MAIVNEIRYFLIIDIYDLLSLQRYEKIRYHIREYALQGSFQEFKAEITYRENKWPSHPLIH